MKDIVDRLGYHADGLDKNGCRLHGDGSETDIAEETREACRIAAEELHATRGLLEQATEALEPMISLADGFKGLCESMSNGREYDPNGMIAKARATLASIRGAK